MVDDLFDSDQELWLRVETATHNAPIRQIVPVPDRSLFVTVGSDKRLKVWDASSDELRCRRVLAGELGPGNDGDLLTAAISADGSRPTLAVVARRAQNDRRVLRLYDIGGEPEQWFQLGSLRWDHLNVVAFTADGRGLIAAAAARLELHNTGSLRRALDGGGLADRPAPLADTSLRSGSMRMTGWARPDGGTRIAVSVWEGHHRSGFPELYDLDDGRQPSFQHVDFQDRRSVFTPDRMAASGRHLAVAPGEGGPLRVFDHDGRLLHTVAAVAAHRPAQLAFSPDGALLVAGSRARTGTEVTVHDAEDGFRRVGSRRYMIEAAAVGFLDDDTVVSAGGSRYSIDRWPARSDRRSERDRRISAESSTTHALAVDDHRILVGHARPTTVDRTLGIDRVDTRSTPIDYPPHEFVAVFDLERREFANDRATLVGPRRDRFVGPLPHHHGGRRLHIDQSTSNLWCDHVPLATLGGWDFAESYGFLPDGRVVFGGRSGDVQVLDIGRWGTVGGRTLRGHTDMVYALAAGDRWLVTGGLDQVIRCWYRPDAERSSGDALAPALNLFLSDDGEWVLWSQTGYYDSSPRGDGHVAFHRNRGEGNEAEVIATDRHARRFYQPELIDRILQTGSEREAMDQLGWAAVEPDRLDQLDLATPPVVTLDGERTRRSASYLTSLAFTVTGGSQPTTRVWVLGDGVTIWEAGPGERPAPHEERSYTVEDLVLSPGENTFRILARNDEVKSTAVNVVVAAPTAEQLAGAEEADQEAAEAPTAAAHSDGGEPEVVQRLQIEVVPPEADPVELVVTRNGEVERRQPVQRPADRAIELVVDLEPGVNRIRVTAVTGDGEDELFASDTVVRATEPHLPEPGDDGTRDATPGRTGTRTSPPPSATPPRPVPRKLYVLSIGVSRHATPDDNLEDLNYAHLDAEEVARTFAGAEGRLFGEVWKEVLVNEHATRSRILAELDRLREAVAEREQQKKDDHQVARDLTVFFFAGHGAAFDADTPDKTLTLITHDVDPKRTSETGLDVDEVGEVLSGLATDIVVLIDACHSGRAGRDLMGHLDERELGKRLHEIGEVTQAVFAAARYDQKSTELMWKGKGHGVFARALLEELDASTGREIAIGELTAGVQRKVRKWTARWPSSKRQDPTFRTYGDFALFDIYK